MFLLIENYLLLSKIRKISDKISNIVENAFDSQLMGEEKYLKTKVNFYDEEINIDFHDKKT